jgi:hypothetical protein
LLPLILFNDEATLRRNGMNNTRSVEAPRSRRYGRTAAMGLIVQPCDEDEDDYFLSFS